MSLEKNVLILHTGGTFGMVFDKSMTAQKQSPHFLSHLLQYVPELLSIAQVEMDVICNIDSSDADPTLWKLIAETISARWNEFDGFVIIHGTDTLAWSASALSFFFEELTKPVVFTGSQRPLSALRNDARINIINSVELATTDIPEVMVCFDNEVHRATRVTKHSNERLYAFKSYNSPVLGHFGVHLSMQKKNIKLPVAEQRRHPPFLNIAIDCNITSLVCVPGAFLSEELSNTIVNETRGIILRGFGSGNLPIEKSQWTYLCRIAFERKIPVVLTSQCPSGSISFAAYENSRTFASLGVISGMDMTFEAVSVKLMVMLGRKVPFEKRHIFFSTPFAEECKNNTFKIGNCP